MYSPTSTKRLSFTRSSVKRRNVSKRGETLPDGRKDVSLIVRDEQQDVVLKKVLANTVELIKSREELAKEFAPKPEPGTEVAVPSDGTVV